MPKNDPKYSPAATLDELREFGAGLVCLDPRFMCFYGARNTYAELQRDYAPKRSVWSVTVHLFREE